jgi:UDP-N-acetylmuramoyl-tripeptide--D-alanyl-D-alanine ligase
MKIEELYQKYLETGIVSTDTRQIKNGSLFFALRGEKFNGNEFAQMALEKGASFAIVDDEKFVSSMSSRKWRWRRAQASRS